MTMMMSMLLIMESLEKGNISLTDEVTVSLNVSSVGGSQIFLEAGEVMNVEDLLKGITIGSGNDDLYMVDFVGRTVLVVFP